jgi:catechol 2,3-dioxygenase-like lactoylglutathione lyase family enzyme
MTVQTISRRHILAGLTTAGGLAAFEGPAVAAPAPTTDRNATGVRINMFTVVTPDLSASAAFYTTLLGYARVGEGQVPTALGQGLAGRRYILLQHSGSDEGMLRLLQAPPGAGANRPRPGSRPWDKGFGAVECSTADIEESYQTLTRAGVKTLSPPTYYFYRDMRRLNGSALYPKSLDTLTYVPIGPAGELVYISVVLPDNFGMKFIGLHTGCHNCFLVNQDREPTLAYYNAVFGLKPIAEYEGTRSSQRAVSRLLGESLDSRVLAGGMGDNFGMEYMQWTPPAGIAAQFWPQSLDRTGHAMMTMSVNDPDAVRARVVAAGLTIESGQPLPLPGSERPDGFVLRGVCGEQIEVIAHP